jgi:hypothetical protein
MMYCFPSFTISCTVLKKTTYHDNPSLMARTLDPHFNTPYSYKSPLPLFSCIETAIQIIGYRTLWPSTTIESPWLTHGHGNHRGGRPFCDQCKGEVNDWWHRHTSTKFLYFPLIQTAINDLCQYDLQVVFHLQVVLWHLCHIYTFSMQHAWAK